MKVLMDGWMDGRVLPHFGLGKAKYTGRDHGSKVNFTCGQDETSIYHGHTEGLNPGPDVRSPDANHCATAPGLSLEVT